MPVKIANIRRFSSRQGVFETNSSSMHSLVILKDCQSIMPPVANWSIDEHDDGSYTVLVGSNSFGRAPFAFLSHPIDKFLYLLASEYSIYSNNDEGREAFIASMRKRLDNCRGFEFTALDWRNRVDYGEVDHQSDHDVWRCLKSQNIDPFDFIFNDNGMIIIDGDEYCEWQNMKDSGLINHNNIAYDMSDDNSD